MAFRRLPGVTYGRGRRLILLAAMRSGYREAVRRGLQSILWHLL